MDNLTRFVALGAASILMACSDPAAPAAALGTYAGTWNFRLYTYDEICSWGNCRHALIAEVACPTTLTITAAVVGTFEGEVAIARDACTGTLPDLTFPGPAPESRLAGRSIRGARSVRFTLDDGDSTAFARVVGCALFPPYDWWALDGTAEDAAITAAGHVGYEDLMADGAPVTTPGGVPVLCDGRRLRFGMNVAVNRTP